MMRLIHKVLYRLLPLEGYLRVVSAMFFIWKRLGIGRYAEATEYVYHLPKLVGEGATAIDIGANLGYYSRYISQAIGEGGRLYSVEPVAPILGVLRHNLRRCKNVEILPYALGEEEREIVMCNDTARYQGYFGTGQNFVGDATTAEGEGERFPALLREPVPPALDPPVLRLREVRVRGAVLPGISPAGAPPSPNRLCATVGSSVSSKGGISASLKPSYGSEERFSTRTRVFFFVAFFAPDVLFLSFFTFSESLPMAHRRSNQFSFFFFFLLAEKASCASGLLS